MLRWIMHVDMDAFFASVEQLDNPSLKGLPVIVGGLSGRGVVSTCSYEARKFGVHSAMPMHMAKRLCPQGIYIQGRMRRYKEISDGIMEIFRSFSPLVEQLSVDEAFLDVTGMEGLYPDVVALGKAVKNKIYEQTGLHASVGIAPNKFLAKLASDLEKPDGAVVQFGGQTAIKLTESLMKMGVPILGTSAENVDAAEDRELFDEILEQCEIPRPTGGTVFTAEEAKKVANRLGYPVLVRPSYVLGGQGMQIAINDHDIDEFIGIINRIAQDHPILVDKYLQGKEIEVDAVCDGEDILIPGIMEHIERAGIHSGDSISVYPAQSISQKTKETIAEYTRRLAKSLHVIGLINIQFIVCGEDVYVIEVNPRSSRTVPYISKVTGIPIVPLATKVIIGHKIKELGYTPGLQPEADYFAIKMPVFSFEKIRGADISLGPEMKSTGECLGIAKTFDEALYKAFIGAGVKLPKHKNMIMTVRDEDKEEAVEIGRRFEKIGYKIFATEGTAKVLTDAGVKAMTVNKIEQESPNLMDLILGHKIDLVIDTPPQGADHSRDGFVIRRNAIETGVNVLTAIDTAKALITSLENTDIQKLTLIDIAKIK